LVCRERIGWKQKGLTYFEDIDKAVDPPIMSEELPIEKIINRLNTAVKEPDKRF
jgi:hypothetical protein